MSDPKTNGPDPMQLLRRAEEGIETAASLVEDAALHLPNDVLGRLRAKLDGAVPAPRQQVGSAEDCKRCGRPNTLWFAQSPLWNAVMRGGSIDGEPIYDDMVCATCFMELAEEAGIADGFQVTAKRVHVELETVTPSGRVWDEYRFRWVEPAEAPK